MDVEDVAVELYGLPLGEFVAARDAVARRLRSEGSGSASAWVKSLRKPTVAAWLVNQLVRARRAGVEELVGVGEQMRSAAGAQDGVWLRELVACRKELVDELVGRARDLADGAGQRVSQQVMEEVGETLLAATADPGVAFELGRGCLTRPLQHVGFGPLGGGEAGQVVSLPAVRAARERDRGRVGREAAGGQVPKRGETTRRDLRREEREEAERPGAERGKAEREREQAEAAAAAAQRRVEGLSAVLDQRREALQNAEATLAERQAAFESARQGRDTARAAVQRARSELKAAQAEAERARRTASALSSSVSRHR